MQWWPSLVGLGLAGLVGYDLANSQELAPALAISALVYLGAAVARKQSAAWPILFASLAIVLIGRALTGWNNTWILLIVALAVMIAGFVLRRDPRHEFPTQAGAMLVFGALSATALLVDETAGSLLVAGGLLAHAGWDIHYHRANRVVARSLAEFCFVFDTLLAGAILFATFAQ